MPKREKLQLLADYFKVPLSAITEGADTQLPQAYADAEMLEYLQALQTRSEMRMLFKLAKNATKEDVETFKHIHLLVKVEGLTLEGVAKRLKGDRKEVINKARVLESLKAIRKQLAEIREEL